MTVKNCYKKGSKYDKNIQHDKYDAIHYKNRFIGFLKLVISKDGIDITSSSDNWCVRMLLGNIL